MIVITEGGGGGVGEGITNYKNCLYQHHCTCESGMTGDIMGEMTKSF